MVIIGKGLNLPDGHPFKTGAIIFGGKLLEGLKKHHARVKEEKARASSSSSPQVQESDPIKDWLEKGMYEAANHQCSTESPSEPTGESDSSTSADEKGCES